MHSLRLFVFLALLLVLAGCAASASAPIAGSGAQHENVGWVHVVADGGHTGIVVRQADMPHGLWPERADFPDAERFEIGWGDYDFYQSDNPGSWTTFKAAFLPTASVLHVVGFRGTAVEYFTGHYSGARDRPETTAAIPAAPPRTPPLPASEGEFARRESGPEGIELVAIALPPGGIDALARYIHEAHLRDGAAPTAPLRAGRYGNSRFYPGRETFHLLRTCNVWTARALRAAGVPVDDAITREGLMAQLRVLGRNNRTAAD